MPNWVKNKAIVEGENKEQINEVMELFRDEVDFNKIVPMPEAIKNTTAPVRNPEDPKNQLLREKYGFDSWYDWSLANWGTKWNAHSSYYEVRGATLVFWYNTAWATPHEFHLALSKKFPDLTFTVEFADEEIGYNCGTLEYKDGEYTEKYMPRVGSREAERWAEELWGGGWVS